MNDLVLYFESQNQYRDFIRDINGIDFWKNESKEEENPNNCEKAMTFKIPDLPYFEIKDPDSDIINIMPINKSYLASGIRLPLPKATADSNY